MTSGKAEEQSAWGASAVAERKSSLDWILIGTGVLAAVLTLVLVSLMGIVSPATSPWKIAVFSATSIFCGGVALLNPRIVFYCFISACMIFPHELEEIFIPLGFMKIYLQDAVYLFLGLYAVWQWIRERVPLHGLRFNQKMILYMALGLWSAGVGLLVTHNEYDNVFGDLRLSFFYFTAYFFALIFTLRPTEITWLKTALLVGAAGAIIKGLLQALTGDFVTRRYGDAAHILTHFEVTFSTFAIYFALARISTHTKHSALWALVALIGCAMVVLANFRTCWVGLTAGLVTLLFLLPARQRKRMWKWGALSLILAAAALALMWHLPVSETHSTIGENIAEKADVKSAMSDPNVSWRMDSYQNAIDLWLKQPWLGRGLGEELEFITATSTGSSMMATGHRVHNSFLWFLMSLGVFGFAVLLYVHGSYVRTVLASLSDKSLVPEARETLLAAMALYVTIMVSACFDVYLESAPPITVISVTMALSLLTIQYAGVRKPCQTVQA